MIAMGEKLQALRKEKQMTQKQVAKRLNVTASVISGYEHGHTSPSLQNLVLLAQIFGVTTDYLLGVEKRRMLFVDDLTDRQLELLELQLLEFRGKR